MGYNNTYRNTCDAKIAPDCRQTESIERQKRPNERLPENVLLPGWIETKDGIVCPPCANMLGLNG